MVEPPINALSDAFRAIAVWLAVKDRLGEEVVLLSEGRIPGSLRGLAYDAILGYLLCYSKVVATGL